MKHSRSGQGTVIIIAGLFICVMAVMQVAQSYLLTQIGDQTTRASLGRMCGLVAESAIDEARLIMAVRVDTRDDELFDLLRTQGPLGTRGSTIKALELRLSDLPRLGKLLATETGKHVEMLEPLKVEVQYAAPLTLVNQVEIEGTIVYKVKTRSLLDKSIVREVEETQGFKMGQIALPAPLPRSPLYIRDPYKFAFGRRAADAGNPAGTDVNNLRAVLVDQHFPKLKSKYADVMREFSRSELNDVAFIKRIKPLYQRIAADNGKDHLAVVDKLGASLHKYDAATNENVAFFLAAGPAAVDLDSLNLQYKLGQRLPALKAAIDEIDRLGPQVQHMYDSNDQSETAYQANVHYTDLMIEELNLLEELLTQIALAQVTLGEVKQAGDAPTWTYMQQMFATVDPNAMAIPYNVLASRAFYRIAEGPGTTVQAEWERLKKRLDAFNAGFCGVVYVDNPTQILSLTGELAGNLVIAVSGKCTIDGLKPKFGPDTLTVVARGGDAGTVKVSGVNTASISTRGAALTLAPGTAIIGTLILDEVPLTLTPPLTGTVQVDPRLAESNKPPFYYVALSPWLRSRSTLRY